MFGDTKEGIATCATGIAAGATGDFALCGLAANIVFGAVGVKRDVWLIEHDEQFASVGVEPLEQSIEPSYPVDI